MDEILATLKRSSVVVQSLPNDDMQSEPGPTSPKRVLAHRRSFFSIVSEGIKAEKVDKEVSSMPLSVDNSNMKPNWNPLSTIREAKNNKRRGKDTSQESQEDSSPKKARHLETPQPQGPRHRRSFYGVLGSRSDNSESTETPKTTRRKSLVDVFNTVSGAVDEFGTRATRRKSISETSDETATKMATRRKSIQDLLGTVGERFAKKNRRGTRASVVSQDGAPGDIFDSPEKSMPVLALPAPALPAVRTFQAFHKPLILLNGSRAANGSTAADQSDLASTVVFEDLHGHNTHAGPAETLSATASQAAEPYFKVPPNTPTFGVTLRAPGAFMKQAIPSPSPERLYPTVPIDFLKDPSPSLLPHIRFADQREPPQYRYSERFDTDSPIRKFIFDPSFSARRLDREERYEHIHQDANSSEINEISERLRVPDTQSKWSSDSSDRSSDAASNDAWRTSESEVQNVVMRGQAITSQSVPGPYQTSDTDYPLRAYPRRDSIELLDEVLEQTASIRGSEEAAATEIQTAQMIERALPRAYEVLRRSIVLDAHLADTSTDDMDGASHIPSQAAKSEPVVVSGPSEKRATKPKARLEKSDRAEPAASMIEKTNTWHIDSDILDEYWPLSGNPYAAWMAVHATAAAQLKAEDTASGARDPNLSSSRATSRSADSGFASQAGSQAGDLPGRHEALGLDDTLWPGKTGEAYRHAFEALAMDIRSKKAMNWARSSNSTTDFQELVPPSVFTGWQAGTARTPSLQSLFSQPPSDVQDHCSTGPVVSRLSDVQLERASPIKTWTQMGSDFLNKFAPEDYLSPTERAQVAVQRATRSNHTTPTITDNNLRGALQYDELECLDSFPWFEFEDKAAAVAALLEEVNLQPEAIKAQDLVRALGQGKQNLPPDSTRVDIKGKSRAIDIPIIRTGSTRATSNTSMKLPRDNAGEDLQPPSTAKEPARVMHNVPGELVPAAPSTATINLEPSGDNLKTSNDVSQGTGLDELCTNAAGIKRFASLRAKKSTRDTAPSVRTATPLGELDVVNTFAVLARQSKMGADENFDHAHFVDMS